MLKYRLLTAIVLAPLIILAIYKLSTIGYTVIVGVVLLLGAWEWSGFIDSQKTIYRIYYVLIVFLGMLVTLWVPTLFLLPFAILIFIWGFFAIYYYQQGKKPLGLQFPEIRILSGLLVLIPCWSGFIALHNYPGLGPNWVLMVLLLAWAADTGGYFFGRFWGKQQLIPKVSPKKTWMGLCGSVIVGMLVAMIGGYFITVSFKEWLWFLLVALVTLLFAVIGDLMVSLLKRQSGLKDSSRILPGHGGILDRVDSITAAVVVFALGAILLKF